MDPREPLSISSVSVPSTMLAACLVLAALPLARAAAQVPCACAGRSPEVPSVAREVRLEDVDMIAAIGDSDTAAFAAGSSSLLEYGTEYWGVSFSTGERPAAARPLEAGAARHGRGLGDLAQPRQPGAGLQPGPGGRQRGQRPAGTRRPGPRPQRGGQVRLLVARPRWSRLCPQRGLGGRGGGPGGAAGGQGGGGGGGPGQVEAGHCLPRG